ncbi:hypothetical protein CH380_14005 [Leptospira adleri]|uniref:Uncharacterized protein n=1 Tax=Leptospira adleri TaxID=2023186 RepID=A0A2M9YM21_9LEPT|nr:hypothetical protein CH380_14005 [Leptospira adleri]PJZ60967.1 hypothetical protein CH376_15760 [Leptospira adleri]
MERIFVSKRRILPSPQKDVFCKDVSELRQSFVKTGAPPPRMGGGGGSAGKSGRLSLYQKISFFASRI